jgi:hypothetical protein
MLVIELQVPATLSLEYTAGLPPLPRVALCGTCVSHPAACLTISPLPLFSQILTTIRFYTKVRQPFCNNKLTPVNSADWFPMIACTHLTFEETVLSKEVKLSLCLIN